MPHLYIVIKKPEKVSSTQKSEVYITLEGAFNQTGEVPIKEGMTMSDLSKGSRGLKRMPAWILFKYE